MIRRPETHAPSGAEKPFAPVVAGGLQGLKWVLACLLLVAVTWMPVLGVHLYRTSLGDRSSGTVVVVFPPTLGARELFRSVAEANGSLVRPVSWFPRTWVASSGEPGFVGRLKERGAWAVYSTELLNARALLTCLQPGTLPGASAATRPL